MEDRLLLRPRATMALILSARVRERRSAEESIRAFIAATGPIAPWMDRMARVR
jgi:hypothetical protein